MRDRGERRLLAWGREEPVGGGGFSLEVEVLRRRDMLEYGDRLQEGWTGEGRAVSNALVGDSSVRLRVRVVDCSGRDAFVRGRWADRLPGFRPTSQSTSYERVTYYEWNSSSITRLRIQCARHTLISSSRRSVTQVHEVDVVGKAS